MHGGDRSRLARAVRVLERRPWLPYLLLTALSHPITEMLVFGERALQTAHDVFDDDVPRLYSIADDWRRFGVSLWDPHLTAGNALFAQFALPPLAPDVLLSFVVPPFVAYFLNAALMAFLAGLAMHLFLRDSLRLPAVACFAGGIMSTLAFWHYIYGYAALLLPLALLWTERAVARERRPRDVVAAALLVAFMAISSQVQIVALAAAATLAWIVLTAPARRETAVRAARFFLPWALGALVAAPVLLTQLLAVADSQRQVWVLTPSASPLGTWLEQLARIPLGVEVRGIGGEASLYGTWFPGAIGLPLLLASLVVPRPARRSRAALVLLIGLLVADLAAILVIPYQDRFGPLASFQFIRVRHLVPPLLIVNTALAIAWLARRSDAADASIGAPAAPIGPARRWAMAGLAALGVVALAPQALVVGRGVLRWLRDGAPLLDPDPAQLGWLAAAVAFGVALVAGMVAATAAWLARRATAPRARDATLATVLAVCLLGGLVVERAGYARAGIFLGPGLGTWAGSVPPTAAHEFIATQPGPGRVLSVVEHANRALSAGLDGVDGYETIYPLRYHELFGALIAPQLATRSVATYFGEWGNRAYAFSPEVSKPIADLLGIRWLYVAPESAIDRAIRSRYPPQGPVGPGWTERFRGADRIVYENPDAFPRAFVVHAAASAPDLDAVRRAMLAATPAELRATAFLEGDVAAGLAPDVAAALAPGLAPDLDAQGSASGGADSATITLDTPDRVEIRASAASPGLLILADTNARGWTAQVDGRDAAIVPVDLALRAVALPSGEHTVTFAYRPIETLGGAAVALATLVAMLLWLVLVRRRSRRDAAERDTGSQG